MARRKWLTSPMTRDDTMTKRTDGTSTGRRVFACRVAVDTPAIVEALAKELGCLRIDGEGELVGACGVMLDRIASGQLKVVRAND